MKRHYRMGQFKTVSQPEVEKRVKDDDEVLFWGDTLSAILSIEEDINQALLELSVSLYVPFRGFTFTSCWMEQCNDPGRLFKRLAAYTSCSNTIKHFLHTFCIFN